MMGHLAVAVAAALLVVAAVGGDGPGGDKLAAYRVVGDAIRDPLTHQSGDPERGRRLILDRETGDCTICHAMPLPQRQFHGNLGPPLDGVGSRYSAGQLRLRIVDPKAINPATAMPAYYKVEGLYRVLDRYRGKSILTAQQVEDVIAYLLTLKQE
jgi:sulfur-oxidizing protein SoxX